MHDPEVRAKVSKTMSGRVITPEHRAKIAEAVKKRHAERRAGMM